MSTIWHRKPSDVVIRRRRQQELEPIHIELGAVRGRSRVFEPTMILAYSFIIIIAVGTGLLMLPFTHHGEGFVPFADALFTATSAATVTGLITQSTPEFWTRSGQIIILVLIFAGGLGIITIASSLLILAGQRISLSQRLLMREALGTSNFGDVTRVTIQVVFWAVAIQAVGFVVLLAGFITIYSPSEAIWQAAFQAVSAFNNAGFTSLLESESLIGFQSNKFLIPVIGLLIVLGSLSYWVIIDGVQHKRWDRLTLNTKIVLATTLGLIAVGALVLLLAEYTNPRTLGPLPLLDKLFTALFQSINRTAGFSTVEIGETTSVVQIFYALLMFIGGASASVAGGIKVTTAAILAGFLVAALRGRDRTVMFGKTIPHLQVQWALVILGIAVLGVGTTTVVVSLAEPDIELLDVLFESVSAFGTVGFSTGITSSLSDISLFALSASMFVGRVVPPMMILLALAAPNQIATHHYAKEDIVIG